jgi:hypothetical protein
LVCGRSASKTFARPDAVERARDDLLEIGRARKHRQRPGLQPADVQQAGEQTGEQVQGLICGGQQLVMIIARQLDVIRAQAADRCLRSGQRRAQVVADRSEAAARAATPSAAAYPASLRRSGRLRTGLGDRIASRQGSAD